MSIKFGPIFHVGYAVPDIDKAMDYMSKTLGIGPFFLERHTAGEHEEYRYHGKDTPQDSMVAHAYTGDLDIELICPLNDAPSPINDYLKTHPEGGIQHLGVLIDTDKWESTLADPEVAKHLVMTGRSNTIRLAFMDGFPMGATAVELIEATEEVRGKFERLKKMCNAWDGTDPIRGKK